MKLKNNEVRALLYHDVENDFSASGFSGKDADLYKLHVKKFKEHLDAISRQDGDTITFTFDDGGRSAHSVIAPMLEKYGWRGIFFIVTDKIDKPGFLTREQIRDLHQRGHIIGSHSHTHPMRFNVLENDQISYELRESRTILETIIGPPVLSVSVPGGFYSKKVANLALKAGYHTLYNSEPTSRSYMFESMLVIGRFGIQMHTSDKEVVALAFGHGFLREKQYFYWNLKKILKILGGPAWISFRKWLLNRPQLIKD